MERKLAAILAADVVGFAGRMSQDEAGTLALIERLNRDVIGMQVQANRGRVFKFMGDGILAEFSSTLEAVNCAFGIQKMMRFLKEQSKEEENFHLRIGVSLGDVVVRDNDLLGDGVNIAARLETLAEPGGVAVSAEVMSQIRGKTDLPLQDAGHQRVKNTDALIHVYMTRARKNTQDAGIFDFDVSTDPTPEISGGCICGAIRYQALMPPISKGYCHCRCCQKFTGSVMSVWAAFPAAAVQFTGNEPTYFPSSPIAERGFCPTCGSSLTYRLKRPKPAGYLVIMSGTLDHLEDYAPLAHSGVESQAPWLEILDELPRTACAEPRVLQEAWRSVGLPEPGTWGPMACPQNVL